MVLRNFQVPYLEQEGYVNLRCAWQLGCPNEIKPYENDPREKQQQGHAGNSYYHAFKEIFGEAREVPHEVGVSCCAQFALTRDKIREIPRSEYVRLREWLAKTPLLDSISGRVMEYSWHSKFGQVFFLLLRKNASMPDCWHSCCPTRSGVDAFAITIRNGCWLLRWALMHFITHASAHEMSCAAFFSYMWSGSSNGCLTNGATSQVCRNAGCH